jgi:hypothetical protein
VTSQNQQTRNRLNNGNIWWAPGKLIHWVKKWTFSLCISDFPNIFKRWKSVW